MSYYLKDHLNPEPTDVQLAVFARHKRNKTSPGNPKWYKPLVVKPFVFKAGLSAWLPRIETGATWNARHARTAACKGQTIMFKYKDGTTKYVTY